MRKLDGASRRAEQQARSLLKKTGENFETKIIKSFPDKRSARAYETDFIKTFRRLFGEDKLPGNLNNR